MMIQRKRLVFLKCYINYHNLFIAKNCKLLVHRFQDFNLGLRAIFSVAMFVLYSEPVEVSEHWSKCFPISTSKKDKLDGILLIMGI